MRKEMLDRATQAVDLAKRAGATDVWAVAGRGRSVSFQVRDGKLEEVKDSTSRSLSIQLFVDGRFSGHSTTDLRPDRLKNFVAEAVALTRALQPDPHRGLPDPALFAGRPEEATLDLVDRGLSSVDRQQRIDWAQSMNSRVSGKSKVISATSGVSDGHSLTAAASSNGFSGAYARTNVGLWTSCTLDDGDKRPEDSMGAFAHHLTQLPSAVGIADDALRLARARLGAGKGAATRTTMVVDPRAAGRLVGRLIGPARGGSVQQQKSFWRGALGKPMVSKRLTLIDDPLIPRGLGSRPFDGEGIAARRMPVIEGGVFRNLYLDSYYARKLGMKPTTGGGSNRVVGLGDKPLASLVADAGSGIYVNSWLGGNMDSTTGDFSFGIRGHEIVGGKLGRPIGEMNVTGNIVTLFKNLAAIGNDPWKYSSVLAPTLVFDAVQFS